MWVQKRMGNRVWRGTRRWGGNGSQTRRDNIIYCAKKFLNNPSLQRLTSQSLA